MKNIYIVMTQTGTLLSKIIKGYTGCEYAHVSISLDKNLDEMYSFGRLNPYNPFWGGFIHERVNSGTFKRFKNTIAGIVELEVTDEQYNNLRNIIKKMEERINPYRFNILGLILVGFNIKYEMEDHFYCAEFLKYLFEECNIENNLPRLVAPDDFKNIKGIKYIYKGKLSEYRENTTEIYSLDLVRKLKEVNGTKQVM